MPCPLPGLLPLLPLLLSLAPAFAGGEPVSATDDGPRVRGVLVGVDRFEDPGVPPLQFARSDAERFRDALIAGSGGAFTAADLPLLSDERARLADVRAALESALLEADEDDVVVVYFSGHGDIEDGQGYLFTHDSTVDDLPATGLRVAELEAWMEASPARHVLLFTDACHSASVGTLRGGGTMSRDAAFQEVIHSLDRSEGGVFNLASSLVRQQSYESWSYCGGGGAFTCALSEGLRGAGDLDGDARVTLAELSTFVQGRVMELTWYDQTPEAKGEYEPDLVLAVRQRDEPEAAAAVGVLGVISAGGGGASFGDTSGEGGGVLGVLSSSGGFGGFGIFGAGGGEEATLDGVALDEAFAEGTWGGEEAAEDDEALMVGLVGGALVDPVVDDSAWAEEEKWREPFLPYGVVGLHGVGLYGKARPLASSGGTDLGMGLGGGAQVVLGLRERWWFNPSLRLAWLQTGGGVPAASGDVVVARPLGRLALELEDRLVLAPGLVNPFLKVGGGTWGGAFGADAGGTTWRVAPLSGPWVVTSGVGVDLMPWWMGSTSLVVEADAVVQLGGIAEAPSPVGRLSLGVEALF